MAKHIIAGRLAGVYLGLWLLSITATLSNDILAFPASWLGTILEGLLE